jgi:hypothetical protein
MLKLRSVDDFNVYSTASMLVREGQGKLIYAGADTGADPQLVFADPHGVFQKRATERGIGPVRMYVYPPLLADLFVPFTYFSVRHGTELWLLATVAALVLSGSLLLKMLHVPWKSTAGLAMLIGLFGLSATAQTLVWGQIAIMLLLLWTAGLFLYQRNLMAASALVMALGTSIKLTPLIVVVPMLVWKQWRWLSWFAGWMVALLGVTYVINGPETIADFYLHVAPAMSAGVPHMQNHTILALVERLYLTFHGDMLLDGPPFVHAAVPHFVSMLGKFIAAILVVAATAVLLWRGRSLDKDGQLRVMAAFAALSLPLAPVSWVHAYVLLVPALTFLWRDALLGLLTRTQVVLLTVCWIETSAVLSHGLAQKMHSSPVRGVLSLAVPLATLVLCALILWDGTRPMWWNGASRRNAERADLREDQAEKMEAFVFRPTAGQAG